MAWSVDCLSPGNVVRCDVRARNGAALVEVWGCREAVTAEWF